MTMPPKKAAAAMKKARMVAPKVKSPSMADEDWAKELARRAIVTTDWNKRQAIQHQQNAEVAKAASFVSYAASQGESNIESLPAAAQSGINGGILCSPRLPPSRMSPEFRERQTYPCTVHGGVGVFSPVTAPRQDEVYNVDLNLVYTMSESPDMRRVPNMFAGSTPDATRALFDEMPGARKMFGEMPVAHLMFTEEARHT
jgi:hypothetical protein